MKSKRGQALVLAAAVSGGYAGAAAYSAWALPSVAIATDFGPGDGLTRYVLTASSGDAAGLLTAVRYTFTSMTAPAGVVEPGVSTTGDTVSGDYSVALGLGMEQGGEVFALSGEKLTLGGTTLTTDDSGEALFALGAATSPADLTLSPSMDLGDGRYVLTVQLYRDGTILGRTFAAPLLVGTAVTPPGASARLTPGPARAPAPATPAPAPARGRVRAPAPARGARVARAARVARRPRASAGPSRSPGTVSSGSPR